jgi:hypothetical protein
MSDGDESDAFLDFLFLALTGFMAMVLLLISHVAVSSESERKLDRAGVLVEIVWPADTDADVDLWVRAPGDTPVGYSNKGGAIFDLLRDDLGLRKDLTGMNYESSVSRGSPAGEYTVNIHLYRRNSTDLPLGVEVLVTIKPYADGPRIIVDQRTVVLRAEGEELTVVRFTLDSDGYQVPGSVNNLDQPLRSWGP